MPQSGKPQKVSPKKSVTSSEPEQGSFVFPNGEKYVGQFVRKAGGRVQRQGVGVHHSLDGSVFSGAWSGDKMNGQGECIHSNGIKYKGDFVDGCYHGNGTMTWPSGCSYAGGFSANRIDGAGEFTDQNGRVWTGNFTGKQVNGLVIKLS